MQNLARNKTKKDDFDRRVDGISTGSYNCVFCFHQINVTVDLALQNRTNGRLVRASHHHMLGPVVTKPSRHHRNELTE